MSAWVVSKHHIDVLVSAAIDREIPVKLDNLAVPVTATEEIAQQIGAMLWAENVRSVVYRYTLSGTDEERSYLQDVQDYSCRFYLGLKPSAVAAALSCYDYQACECSDYEGTVAGAVCPPAASRHRQTQRAGMRALGFR